MRFTYLILFVVIYIENGDDDEQSFSFLRVMQFHVVRFGLSRNLGLGLAAIRRVGSNSMSAF